MSQFDPADEKLEQAHIELRETGPEPELIPTPAKEGAAQSSAELPSAIQPDRLEMTPWKKGRNELTQNMQFICAPIDLENPQSYAGLWIRAGAFVADQLIGLVFYALQFILVATIPIMLAIPFTAEGVANAMLFEWIVLVLVFSIYCAVMESSSKQATFGKMIFRIHTIGANGERIGLWRACVRNCQRWCYYPLLVEGMCFIAMEHGRAAGLWILVLIMALIAVEPMILILSKRKQCLHDMVARTYVVKDHYPTVPSSTTTSTGNSARISGN